MACSDEGHDLNSYGLYSYGTRVDVHIHAHVWKFTDVLVYTYVHTNVHTNSYIVMA